MTTDEAEKILQRAFPRGAWALLREVRSTVDGSNPLRVADALAFAMTGPFELHGIELKVSRGDWLAERADPTKSANVMRYCDRWWLAAPRTVLQPGELPSSWGFIELLPNGLHRVAVDAPRLFPVEWSRGFAASVSRALARQMPLAGTVDDFLDALRPLVYGATL